MHDDDAYRKRVDGIVAGVIDMRAPILESIHFTFLLENIPISLREQIVRHRVGHKFGDRTGIDIIPELSSAGFFSQSSRTMDLSTFADEGRYYIPEELDDEIADTKISPRQIFKNAVVSSGEVYKRLTRRGVAPEIARQVMPLCATHRITWTVNLQALLGLISKRSCWLAQLGMWKWILKDMVQAVGESCGEIVTQALLPPCIKDSRFADCPYKIDNQTRLNTGDVGVPCPLYLKNHRKDACLALTEARDTLSACGGTVPDLWKYDTDDAEWTIPPRQLQEFKRLSAEFIELLRPCMHERWKWHFEMPSVVVR
jgi:thymidylate synthase ThyX